MDHPRCAFGASPSRGATSAAWQSRFHGVRLVAECHSQDCRLSGKDN